MPIPTPPFTIGVEEEYQIIDPVSRKLTPNISNFLTKSEMEPYNVSIMPELMQSQVEVATTVCRNIKEVRLEIILLRNSVRKLAKLNDVEIAAAGTHPFSSWKEQKITEKERYMESLNDLQNVARTMVTFGTHVHIGFEPNQQELMVEIMNQARYFLPHILALSTSSPFWMGQNTRLKSYRSILTGMLPRTGINPAFASYAEYQNFLDTMAEVGAFGKEKHAKGRIWWDIRPHHLYPTLEFRVCDIATKIDELLCIAAVIQALCAKLFHLRNKNLSWRHYPTMLIEENKYLAMQYGISGELIDLGIEKLVPFPDLMEDFIEILGEIPDELGTRKEIDYIYTILKEGTSADRQLKTFYDHGGEENKEEAFRAVVDQLIKETAEGI